MKDDTMTRLLALFLCLATPALAQDADIGRALYHQHCATCHGLEGAGDGPMAGVLTIPPADLTALQSANNGHFPLERVVHRIDGRDPLTSHGSPMPVYGPYFEGKWDVRLLDASGRAVLTSQPIADLTAFLREIQARE